MEKWIVVVDDNKTLCDAMAETLRRSEYVVKGFTNGQSALKYFQDKPAPLVITDLRMAPVDGLQVLKEVKKISPSSEVLLVSAYGTVEAAVEAMNGGAVDFLTKPFSNQELRARVKRIFNGLEQQALLEKLRDENHYLSAEIERQFPEFIGKSPAMCQVMTLIDKTAPVDSAVLISGESGTGKELAARAIHRKSMRGKGPFIRVNCGALNDNLLESELFGHEKGAFTGAYTQRKGRFELAEGGTLFLDEVGDISTAMQVKLLRALQEKEFERVGGEKTLRVNVRIIAATNKDLKKMVKDGTYRNDLYYRLNVIPIHLPPLRQRREDIPALVAFMLEKHRAISVTPPVSIAAMNLLQDYAWPGNIRELENIIERVLVIRTGEGIEAADLAAYLETGVGPSQGAHPQTLTEALEQTEKQMIKSALTRCAGVKSRTARLLGLKTGALYYKLEKYGLL